MTIRFKKAVLASALLALSPGLLAAPVLEEILVTAQKRSQNLQDVPISVTAVKGDFMEKAGINNMMDLANFVPNFTITQSSQLTNSRMSIRGVSSVGNTAIEPSVGVFVDGVYYPRPGSLLGNLVDIETAEVLRGPQGTLFGRNTPVGALNITTRKPSDENEGRLSVNYGNYEAKTVSGFIGGGLTDDVAGRLSFNWSDRDGYGKNLFDGKEFGDREDKLVRGKLLFSPSDNLEINVIADYSKINHTGGIVEVVSGTEKASFDATLGALGYGAPDSSDTFDYEVDQHHGDNSEDEQWGVSVDVMWKMASGMSLRSITSHRDWENEYLNESSLRVGAEILPRNTVYDTTTTSQEFQLISPEGKTFEYVTGLYIYQEEYNIHQWFDDGANLCNAVAGLAGPAGAAECAAIQANNTPFVDANFEQDLDGWAAFAQGTYNFSSDLRVTAGLRWTDDEKDGSFNQVVEYAGTGVPGPFPIALAQALNFRVNESVPNLKFEDEELTWLTNISYDVNDDVMLFASVSTGFKSGGFNSEGASSALGLDRRTFESEESINYELGAKSTLWDGRAQVNATLYRTDLDNFQDRAFDGTSFITANAGELRLEGVEVDVRAALTERLTVTAGVAYSETEFLEYPNAPCLPASGSGCVQDLKGKGNHRAPQWQTSVTAEWRDKLPGSDLEWFVQAAHQFVDDANIGGQTNHNPQTIQANYTLTNMRLGLQAHDDAWKVEAYANNLGDTGYCSSAFDQPLGGPLNATSAVDNTSVIRCTVGAPRTYGVQATWNF